MAPVSASPFLWRVFSNQVTWGSVNISGFSLTSIAGVQISFKVVDFSLIFIAHSFKLLKEEGALSQGVMQVE